MFYFFYKFFSKNLSAKYYQENTAKEKERLQKEAYKRYHNDSKEEREKSDNMVVNATKIYQEMKKYYFFIKESVTKFFFLRL